MTRDGPPAWGLDEVITTPHQKNDLVTKHIQVTQTWTYPFAQPKQSKRDMRFGTWNVLSLYSSCSFTTAARVLAIYK